MGFDFLNTYPYRIFHPAFKLIARHLAAMQARLFALYRKELQPIYGIAAALDRLQKRRCVASSSQLERIRLTLEVTGLLDWFDPHIFSAAMVAEGKPAPDLFFACRCANGCAGAIMRRDRR